MKRRPFGRSSQYGEAVGPWAAVHRCYKWTVCLPWRLSHSWLSKHRQFIPSTTHGLVKPPPRLPRYRDPRNLVRFPHLPHTRLTYHRTWETGLETEIRVAAFSPAFFCPHRGDSGDSKPALPGFPCAPLCPLWFKLFSSTATSDADENATNLRDSPVWDRTENREQRTEHNRPTHPDHSPDNPHFAPRIQ